MTLLGSGMLLGLGTNLAKGLPWDINIIIKSTLPKQNCKYHLDYSIHLKILVLFLLVLAKVFFLVIVSSSTRLDKILSFSSTFPNLSSI